MGRRGGPGVALQFWVVGGSMVILSVAWPEFFGFLFWYGLLTGFLGFLFGLRGSR